MSNSIFVHDRLSAEKLRLNLIKLLWYRLTNSILINPHAIHSIETRLQLSSYR